MSLLAEEAKLTAAQGVVGTIHTIQSFSRWQRLIIVLCLVLLVPVYLLSGVLASKYFENKYSTFVLKPVDAAVTALPIKVVETKIFEYAQDQYSAYAEISNPNLNLHLRRGAYRFTFYKSGARVGDAHGTFFALAGEDKYLIVPKIITDIKPDTAIVEFLDIQWSRAKTLPSLQFAKQPQSLYNEIDPVRFVVESGFLNTSEYTLPDVRLSILLKDSHGNVITVTERHENNVKSKEQRAFRIIYPGLFSPAGDKPTATIQIESSPFEVQSGSE